MDGATRSPVLRQRPGVARTYPANDWHRPRIIVEFLCRPPAEAGGTHELTHRPPNAVHLSRQDTL